MMKFKLRWMIIPGLLVAFGQAAFGQDAAQVAQDHLTVAKSYEEKAKVYDRMATEHEAMLAERHKSYDESRSWDSLNRTNRLYTNDFLTPLMLGQKHRHCETIAKNSKALRARLLEFAEFHKQQAAELEKAIQAGSNGS